jgi:N utilization substance protein B
MLYVDSIPIKVSINEAVEIAKKYSTQEDAAYINGVLGSVAANIEK